MKIEEIEELWTADAPVDRQRIESESASIPALHNKYFKILTREKLILERLKTEFPILYKDKYDYFIGTIDRETMEKRGWEPFHQKVMKSDTDRFMNADQDIINATLTIAMAQAKVDYLNSIISMINGRSFHINGIINWAKFQAGVN